MQFCTYMEKSYITSWFSYGRVDIMDKSYSGASFCVTFLHCPYLQFCFPRGLVVPTATVIHCLGFSCLKECQSTTVHGQIYLNLKYFVGACKRILTVFQEHPLYPQCYIVTLTGNILESHLANFSQLTS